MEEKTARPPGQDTASSQASASASAESSELVRLREQYRERSQWLRRLSWLMLFSVPALYIYLNFFAIWVDKLFSSWPGSDWGTTIFFQLISGLYLLLGVATVGLVVLRRRTWQAYYNQPPTPPAAASAPLKGLFDQPSEQDTLGFKTLAEAISGLLRNPFTQAPYSLVLSGSWGSGKSSLMAQIRRTLTAEDAPAPFQSLWFNVWHYQSEQHLLASFLGAILARCEELPGFYRRLWWQRFINQGFGEAVRTAFVFALLLLAAVGAGMAVWQRITAVEGSTSAAPAAFWLGHTSNAALGALLATWAGAAWSLLKAWQERANLLAGLIPLDRFRFEASRADAGFRRKYQQEFRQIMRAAPPGTRFLIFVDDIDRITGDRVLELLESINFISDTASQPERERAAEAKLYFVLGMYVPEVVRTLGEALDQKQNMPEGQAAIHAARYLAKLVDLVDLVVPLPGLQNCTPDQLKQLLFGGSTPAIAAPNSSSVAVAA